jgi:hypothetical protein
MIEAHQTGMGRTAVAGKEKGEESRLGGLVVRG